MAGINAVAQTAEVALSAATVKTVMQVIAPTNQRLKLTEWSVSFDGISPTAEPVQVELLRQTTAGTVTGLTPVKRSAGSETLQATASHTATAEPTAGDVLEAIEVHPQGGYAKVFPLGREIEVPGGTRIGIRCTAPATVNVRAVMAWEE
ncbi:MAG: hypothetical protein ACOYD4_06820 [Solirubrobacterales bacterium]